ncbi:hypothetical protein CEUSTIGMA_g5999.t1 [Chlamydomonas eustigma]|uniref:Uncharacterized protein n=1 Tax=Chlamydomonas eustigma TaxID=1157962 RepID=A0A250X6L0_9CHLO|nr:hypothetical protein CEUSTIGMA_g5999.t1 [Chlamydomonas eustigma]|eukprot:GAX78559.1 hypothetical protein CEUSTIGMA_g5999.t1 [Chlamydomonas eustigma]
MCWVPMSLKAMKAASYLEVFLIPGELGSGFWLSLSSPQLSTLVQDKLQKEDNSVVAQQTRRSEDIKVFCSVLFFSVHVKRFWFKDQMFKGCLFIMMCYAEICPNEVLIKS